MRMNFDWNKLQKADIAFWNSVDAAVTTLLCYQAPKTNRTSYRAFYGDQRICAVPSSAVFAPQLTNLYNFFSRSPECFVPIHGYICEMSGTENPMAFGRKELLIRLWNTSLQGSPPEHVILYVIALFRQIDPFFRGGDGNEWDLLAVTSAYPTSKLPVTEAKKVFNQLYTKWVQYIKHHYNRLLLGVDDKSKLYTMTRCIDSIRNHERNSLALFAEGLCNSVIVMDDTLLHFLPPLRPEEVKEWYLTPIIDRCFLDSFIKEHTFPVKLRPDLIKFLQLKKKILLKDEATYGSLPADLCFSYAIDNKTYYDIFYDDSSEMFTSRLSQYSLLRPAKKNIFLRLDFERQPPKEYLYHVTDGDWNRLCELAKIIACALSTQKLFNGVVVLPTTSVSALIPILFMAYGRALPPMKEIYNIREYSKNSSIDRLISMKWNGVPFLFCSSKKMTRQEEYSPDDSHGSSIHFDCSSENIRLNPEQWDRLRKIFSGVTLTCQDTILGHKKHRNVMQWFLIGDDKAIQALRSKNIRVWRVSFTPYNRNMWDCASQWMQQVLPLWGLLQLKKPPKKDKLDVKYETIRLFMENCCRIIKTDGEFVPARELYEEYKAYCTRMNRNDILLFKDFNKTIEQDYGQKRKSLHRTNGTNLTGFYRIIYIGESAKQFTKADIMKAKKEAFFRQLDQIEAEVRKHFPTYPF